VFTCATVACCRHKRQQDRWLLSNAQPLDDRPVPGIVHIAKIIQQSPATADKLEKTPSGVVILLMKLEMLRQIRNPVRQHGNLNFRRSGIIVMLPMPFD
jgi:hypothetical protein